jgi:hypothetical protein
MGYRLEWRLLGREGRFLDRGEIDDDFPDRQSALVALGALLLHFPVWGRKDVEGCWWARRSADADLELQLVLREPMLCEEPMLPTIVAARQNEHAGTTVLLTLAE